jgi:hypothetical protein
MLIGIGGMRTQRRLSAAPAAVAAVAVCAVVAVAQTNLGDYGRPGPGADNAAPAIAALIAGHVGSAVDVQPAMGPVSLLLRAPFAALAGGDPVWRYRLGVLACLLGAAALAAAVDRLLARRGGTLLDRVLTGLLLLSGPAVLAALDKGHPEEVLGGALAVGAVLAARAGRPVVAALLLGLAVATKQWALLAAFPVLLALPAGRRAAALAALAVAALFVLPPVAASYSRYHDATASLARATGVYAQSVWWPLSAQHATRLVTPDGALLTVTSARMPLGLTRGSTSMLTLLLGGALALRWRRADPLGVLAVLLALRCALDPLNLEYYMAPALMALATWDALCRDGPPVVAVSGTIGTALAFRWQSSLHGGGAFALWLLLTAPVLLALAPARRLAGCQDASSSSPTRSPG